MKIRRLTLEELETVPGMQSPVPDSLFAIGAVDEQGVGACIGVFLVLHADPIWIRPDLRNHGRLPLRLWQETRAEIAARRLGSEVFVGMTPDNPGQPTEDLVARMCVAAGGEELRARFFVIPVSGE